MEWLELKIDTSHAGLDAVTDMLEQQGVTGVMIDDEADFQSFLENNRQYWDYVDDDLLAQKKGVSRVTFYLERNEDAYGTVAAVRMAMSALKKDHPEYAPLLLTMADVADEDWENNWKIYYKPLEIGDRLLVRPSWEKAEDTGRIVLSLDPGMAFGTGSHHTTRMCLEFLEKTVKAGDYMIDMGCGSGILSIASLLLGAKEAVAVDIDPIAEKIAYENAAMNGIGKDTYTVLVGDVLSDSALQDKLCEKKYDVVAANIVASVIIELSAIVPKLIKKDGVFIMSGIIAERLDEVLCALDKNGFEVLEVKAGDDWRAILARPKR